MSGHAKRETWRTWVPDAGDPVLITRAELLGKLERLGLTIAASTLRSWEAQGLVPAPQVEKNGTPGSYPWWMIDLVCYVRRWQRERAGADQIRAGTRWEAHRLAYEDRYQHLNQLSALPAWRSWGRALILGDHIPSPPSDLAAVLAALVERSTPLIALYAYPVATFYAQRRDCVLRGVSLRIELADGEVVDLPLPAPTLPEKGAER